MVVFRYRLGQIKSTVNFVYGNFTEIKTTDFVEAADCN